MSMKRTREELDNIAVSIASHTASFQFVPLALLRIGKLFNFTFELKTYICIRIKGATMRFLLFCSNNDPLWVFKLRNVTMANACVSCSSVRFRSYLCWLLIYVLPVIRGGHFRGGYISWRTLPSNETNATMVTINIQQTYWWSYRLVPCVAAPIGGPGSLVCRTSNCSNYVSYMANVSAPCIAFDVGLDASTAQSVTPVTLQAGSRLVIGYFSSAWLPLVNSNSVAFSLGILIDLNVRYDTGRINSSPTSTMAALVTVLPNTRQILRIPMSDVDSDVVKCRWASGTYMIDSSTIDECGGICGNLPGAQLYSSSNTDNECMLVFTTTLPGYYVVALQIEDFMPSAPNGSALSSIPLQFLVQAINTTCNQPNITGQLTNGAFIAVQVNKTFSTTIIVEAGCNATNITRFLTIVSPSNNVTTSRVLALDSMTYSMNFTWTPVDNQIGSTQLFCTVAIDANNLQSNQFCLNFVVPAITTSTSTTTGATITSTNTDSITITIHRTVDLTWILGLGIPLALLAGILGSCIACRCYDSLCWYVSWKLAHVFLIWRFWFY